MAIRNFRSAVDIEIPSRSSVRMVTQYWVGGVRSIPLLRLGLIRYCKQDFIVFCPLKALNFAAASVAASAKVAGGRSSLEAVSIFIDNVF